MDDLSSAHVYLRLNKNEKLEDINPEIIQKCGQLVKANSIEGCKLKEVTVIYTRWRNLLKTNDMVAGAVSFHDRLKVKRIKIEKNNTIVNKINKTKTESFPNLAELQQQRAHEYMLEQKEIRRLQYETDKIAVKTAKQQRKLCIVLYCIYTY